MALVVHQVTLPYLSLSKIGSRGSLRTFLKLILPLPVVRHCRPLRDHQLPGNLPSDMMPYLVKYSAVVGEEK